MNDDLPLNHFDLTSEAVRERFRSARRQGNPLWLWPETTIEGWQAALAQIARATRLILSRTEPCARLEGPVDDIGTAAFTSGMGPLLGYWAGQGLLDVEPPVRSLLRLHYAHNCRRMESLARHAAMAVEALASAGVGVTVLKGMHTAYSYFPEPGTRPASDIDLLIEPADHPIAADTLARLGYVPGAVSCGEQAWRMSGSPTEPRSLSLTHQDNPWNIDLHTSLDRRYSPGASMIRLDRAVGERIRQPWPLTEKGTVFPPGELALHLAVHAGMQFVSLTMVRLTELVLVIESVKEDRTRFWDEFLNLAERTGEASSAYPALYFANCLVEGSVPQEVLQGLDRQLPAAVRRVAHRFTPATCQRMRRYSLEERFMWARTFRGWTRELAWGLFPHAKLGELLQIYASRFWILVRGPITR